MADKLKKIIISTLIVLFFSLVTLIFCYTPFVAIYNLSDTINLSYDDLQLLKDEKPFGRFVNCEVSGTCLASTDGNSEIYINLKLLNLISLRRLRVNTKDIDLFVGGNIVGFSLNGDGVVIISTGQVETKNGKVNTLQNSNIKKGDIIKEINGEKIHGIKDVNRIVNENNVLIKNEAKSKPNASESVDKNKIEINSDSAHNTNEIFELTILRNGEILKTNISRALDKNSGTYKLGLWVKDDASGIGTLTYIKEEDGRFGALGHAICDNDTKTIFNIDSGKMYPCTVIGYNKGVKGKAGELKGLFMQGKNYLGEVDKNSNYGVYGTVNEDSGILNNKTKLKAGGRFYAKPGKAYIRTSIDGKRAKDYEIEIIKTNYQSTSNEKSMVLKVTDKELISKTGGIIQGMSGSPIIQNDRVVGAVTHVFINDPTKGFGIYLDWMINM